MQGTCSGTTGHFECEMNGCDWKYKGILQYGIGGKRRNCWVARAGRGEISMFGVGCVGGEGYYCRFVAEMVDCYRLGLCGC